MLGLRGWPTRRHVFLRAASLAAAGSVPSLSRPAIGQGAGGVLRVIPAANLALLDPIWTTAVSTKNHGYLVYDQIAAVDAQYMPRPQMANGWLVEDDGRTWTFTLREGLRFHDGEPVRAQDCVASIRRWWARDGFGGLLAAATDEVAALDDKGFRFRLKRPFPLLAHALGKSNASPCFIMPERLARTDPFQQVRDATGSGPFRFLPDEWVAGVRSAYARFDGYVPRQEPPSSIAGGRVPRVARIEWTVIPDAATAAAAMLSGEQDYWEAVQHDLAPRLRRSRDLVVEPRDRTGTYTTLRFNHLQPPFNNAALRRAVAMGVDQADYMRAVAGDEPNGYGECHGFFACGTPLGAEVAADKLRGGDPARARRAVQEAGYGGERVVQLVASDIGPISATSMVTADLLRRLGFNVDYVSADFGTVVQRRTSKEPVERGGWSVFHALWNGADVLNPAVNQSLFAGGSRAWFGWPEDPELEHLRSAWLDAADDAEQRRIASAMQLRAAETLPYVPLGYYIQPVAWRRTVTGVLPSPTTTYWNIAKTA